MCGRFTLRAPPDAWVKTLGLEQTPNLPARYNIAPTHEAPVVRQRWDTGVRELALLRWGLIPPWSEGPNSGYSMINARAETVAVKPAFRGAFRYRRCLVPADGFFEWQKTGGSKQPYRICLKGEEPFAFAGLWERWHGRDETLIESFTIIVTTANELLRPIHDRMPVILDPTDYGLWVEGGPEAALEARKLLRPYPAERLVAYVVSRRVNNPRYDDAACIEPIGQASHV